MKSKYAILQEQHSKLMQANIKLLQENERLRIELINAGKGKKCG